MPKKIELKEILKKNPHIDPDALAEALKMAEQIQRLGISKRGYRLASPLARRRVGTGQTKGDPRTVRLHHR